METQFHPGGEKHPFNSSAWHFDPVLERLQKTQEMLDVTFLNPP